MYLLDSCEWGENSFVCVLKNDVDGLIDDATNENLQKQFFESNQTLYFGSQKHAIK